MKNFEIFFDVHMDTSVIVDNIKKNFKIFHFLAKFLNFLKGPSMDFFSKIGFLSPHMHGCFSCCYGRATLVATL